MGAGSEWIAASEANSLGACEADHVGVSPQEDRGGTKGAVGEGEGGEEKGGLDVAGARLSGPEGE
jgi:hypothetical protein